MKVELPPVSSDPLVDALQVLRPRGTMYTQCALTAPWGISSPRMDHTLMFHVVTSGQCWLMADGHESTKLRRGDLALLPRGYEHALVSEPGARTTSLFDMPLIRVSEHFETIRCGNGGAATELICGTMQFDHPAAKHLLALLPDIIAIDPASSLCSDWLHSTLTLIAAEASAPRISSDAVITRLADVIVILAIRSWIERDPAAQVGWLRALRDRQLGRAIALIHREPARAWTIARLADEVAMSRSAFAARFAELVGMTVMQYVTQWRMQIAYSELQHAQTRVADLAARMGYQSEAAFSRAFKRFSGISPSEVRTQRAADPSHATL